MGAKKIDHKNLLRFSDQAKKFKKARFTVCTDMFTEYRVTKFLFGLSKVFSSVQILSFALDKNIPDLWIDEELLKTSTSVFDFVHFGSAMEKNFYAFQVLALIMIVLLLINTAMIVTLIINQSVRNSRQFTTRFKKSLSTYTAVFTFLTSHLFSYVILQIITASFLCKSDDDNSTSGESFFDNTHNKCFSILHILNISIAVVSIICLFYILRTAYQCFFDPNPNSKQAYAKLNIYPPIVEQFPILLGSVFSIVDYYSDYRKWIIVIMLAIMIIDTFDDLHQPEYYHKCISTVSDICRGVKLAVYFGVTIKLNFDKSSTVLSDLFYIVPCSFLCFLFIRTFKSWIQGDVLSKNLVKIERKQTLTYHISTLFLLVKKFTNVKNNSSFVKLQGYLSLNQNLFIGDSKGEDIWVNLVTYGKSQMIPILRKEIVLLKRDMERKQEVDIQSESDYMESEIEFSQDRSSITRTESNNQVERDRLLTTGRQKGSILTAQLTPMEAQISHKSIEKSQYSVGTKQTLEHALDNMKPFQIEHLDVGYYLNQMLNYLLGLVSEHHNVDPEIILIRSVIHTYLIENNFEGLYELEKIPDSKQMTTQQRLMAFRLRTKIEKKLRIKDKVFDMNIQYLIHSYNYLNKFIDQIRKTAEILKLFWSELSLNVPDKFRLEFFGQTISEEGKKVDNMYKDMEVSSEYEMKATLVYIGFLTRALNKEEASSEIRILLNKVGLGRVLENRKKKSHMTENETGKFKTIPETMAHLNNLIHGNEPDEKYGFDYLSEAHGMAKMGLVVVSANDYNMGKVLNMNERVHQILGYTQLDLIGGTIETIVPSFFQRDHQTWMRNYFKRGGHDSIFEHGPRLLFAKNKKGYLIPCHIDAKVVPDLDDGVKVIGVIDSVEPSLQDDKNQTEDEQRLHKTQRKFIVEEEDLNIEELGKKVIYNILFLKSTHQIIDVTESCHTYLGLKSNFFKPEYYNQEKKKICLGDIAPQFSEMLKLPLKVPQLLEQDYVFKVAFDTTGLENKYLEVRNDEENVEDIKQEYEALTKRMDAVKRKNAEDIEEEDEIIINQNKRSHFYKAKVLEPIMDNNSESSDYSEFQEFNIQEKLESLKDPTENINQNTYYPQKMFRSSIFDAHLSSIETQVFPENELLCLTMQEFVKDSDYDSDVHSLKMEIVTAEFEAKNSKKDYLDSSKKIMNSEMLELHEGVIDLEAIQQAKVIQSKINSKTMPSEYLNLKLFTIICLILVTISAFFENSSTKNKVTSLSSLASKVNLFNKITIQMLSLGFSTRRFMLSHTFPTSSTYELLFNSSQIVDDPIPLTPVLTKESYIQQVDLMDQLITDESFISIFRADDEYPYSSVETRNLLVSRTRKFYRESRPQDALFSMVSFGKILSEFQNWDGELLINGSQNSQIASPMSSYFMIVDNAYNSSLENLEYLNLQRESTLQEEVTNEKKTQNIWAGITLFLIVASGVYLCVLVVKLLKRGGEVWEYFREIKKPWIVEQIVNLESFILDLKIPKSQRKDLKRTPEIFSTLGIDGVHYKYEEDLSSEIENEDLKKDNNEVIKPNPTPSGQRVETVETNRNLLTTQGDDLIDSVRKKQKSNRKYTNSNNSKKIENSLNFSSVDNEERVAEFKKAKPQIIRMIFCHLVPLLILFSASTLVSYFWKVQFRSNILNAEKASNTYGKFTITFTQLFGELQAELSRDSDPDLLFNKTKITELLDETYFYMDKLTKQNGEVEFSDSLQDFLQTAMFKTACGLNWVIDENHDDIIFSDECSDDELLNKGLITTATYVLENMRDISKNTELNSSNQANSIKSGHSILGTDIYIKTEKYFKSCNIGMKNLQKQIGLNIAKYEERSATIANLFMAFSLFKSSVLGIGILIYYLSVLRKIMIRKIALLGILPLRLILSSKNLQELALES